MLVLGGPQTPRSAARGLSDTAPARQTGFTGMHGIAVLKSGSWQVAVRPAGAAPATPPAPLAPFLCRRATDAVDKQKRTPVRSMSPTSSSYALLWQYSLHPGQRARPVVVLAAASPRLGAATLAAPCCGRRVPPHTLLFSNAASCILVLHTCPAWQLLPMRRLRASGGSGHSQSFLQPGCSS